MTSLRELAVPWLLALIIDSVTTKRAGAFWRGLTAPSGAGLWSEQQWVSSVWAGKRGQ